MEYSIVVAASKGYMPGIKAFLNSFEYYHDTARYTIYLLSFDLSEDFLKEISRPWLKVVSTDSKVFKGFENNSAWGTKIPRFKFASELSGVVMLADADMFFCSDMIMYFKIAEAGLIVAGANGSNFRFHEGWKEKYQINIPNSFDYKTITSVPTIMDTSKHGEVWKRIYEHKRTIRTGADFDLQNIFMFVYNKLDSIIVLPSQQVTGIHHFMLKQNTRAVKKENKLMTEDGLEVLMVHGKWWQPGWYENLMVTMKKFCHGNEICLKQAEDSRRLLKLEFDKWEGLK